MDIKNPSEAKTNVLSGLTVALALVVGADAILTQSAYFGCSISDL